MAELKTLGYAHKDAQATLDEFSAQGYHILDIRLHAASNKPGFSGAELAARYGKGYHKIPALGNRNKGTGRDIDLKNTEQGLQQLKRAIDRAPGILLCGCLRVYACHRFYVAQLAAREFPGLQVEHLLQSGEAGMLAPNRAISFNRDRCAWVEDGKQCELEPWQGRTCSRCRKPICEIHTREREGIFVDRAFYECPDCYEEYLNSRESY